MKRSFVLFGGVGLLAFGCGGDTSTTSTTNVETTDADSSSGGVVSLTETGMPETSSDGSTTDVDTSTGPGPESSSSDDGASSSSSDGAATCGDGIVSGSEDCDGVDLGGATCASIGMTGGTLACADDCTFDTSACAFCGNGTIDEGEVCDGSLGGESCVSQGFDSGSLDCAADCLGFDTTGCGSCGNDVIDGTEFCDGTNLDGNDCFSLGLGFDSGTLSCAANCTGFDTSTCGTCGNDIVDGDEDCDGISVGGETCVSQGYDGGTLYCGAACSGFDFAQCTTCGNGTIEGNEVCDTDDLGGETCASIGLSGGTLACSGSCGYDVSMCDIPGNPIGSDSYYDGYYFTPPMLPCDDVTLTGTSAGAGDDTNLQVPIGFTFPFYDGNFDNVSLGSNGRMHFSTDEYLTYSNTCLPTASAPINYNIYAFWDDLNANVGGNVYYQTLGPAGDQRFIAQWNIAHYLGNGDLIDVRVMLSEATGQITVCYVDTLAAGDPGDNGAEATSGIQLDGVDYIGYSCDMPNLTNGLQLLYIPN